MGQFKMIFGYELKQNLRKKSFTVVTLLIIAALAVVLFFPRIQEAFLQQNADGTQEALPVMLLQVADKAQEEPIEELFSAAFADYAVQLTSEDADAIRDRIIAGDVKCAFAITAPDSYTYYVNNLSAYDTAQERAQMVLTQLWQRNTMLDSGMTAEQVAAAMGVQINGQVENLGKNQIENMLYTYIMMFALFTVIMLYGQMVAMNVATEKSSRAMELLTTSAKPTAMMFGKILAACLTGFIQLAAIFGAALLFYNCNQAYWADSMFVTSMFSIPPELLGYMLLYFVLGFLLYAFLYGAVGSLVSRMEDVNSMVLPMTVLITAGTLVSTTVISGGDANSTLVVACSYIPFTSPMTMFTRIAMSNVAWHEVVISAGILVASCAVIGVLSARIYRVGVLLYGNRPSVSTIVKAMKKS